MRINENIALAKSILRKNSISEDDVDYLKIKELVGKSVGYIGILTKLRYIDNIKDFDELTSIYDVIKDSKIDIAKLTKMSYEDILDIFYNEINVSKNKDYELIYKDDTFSYFRVYTYEGILQIGSPAWCLKTKSHWNNYQAKFPYQWVVIDNKYVRNIMTPNNFYLNDTYVNRKKPWIRYGLSFSGSDTIYKEYVAHDDNDEKQINDAANYTFSYIVITINNLIKGEKKTYHQDFPGCKIIDSSDDFSYFNINSDKTKEYLKLKPSTSKYYIPEDRNILILNKKYELYPIIINIRSESYPIIKHLSNKDKKSDTVKDNGRIYNILKSELNMSMNVAYIGLRIKFGFLKEEEIKTGFIFKVGKWAIFEWNENNHIVVNLKIDAINLPAININGKESWGTEPCFYFVNISKNENEIELDTEESKEILRLLKEKYDKENPTNIKKFRNFLGL